MPNKITNNASRDKIIERTHPNGSVTYHHYNKDDNKEYQLVPFSEGRYGYFSDDNIYHSFDISPEALKANDPLNQLEEIVSPLHLVGNVTNGIGFGLSQVLPESANKVLSYGRYVSPSYWIDRASGLSDRDIMSGKGNMMGSGIGALLDTMEGGKIIGKAISKLPKSNLLPSALARDMTSFDEALLKGRQQERLASEAVDTGRTPVNTSTTPTPTETGRVITNFLDSEIFGDIPTTRAEIEAQSNTPNSTPNSTSTTSTIVTPEVHPIQERLQNAIAGLERNPDGTLRLPNSDADSNIAPTATTSPSSTPSSTPSSASSVAPSQPPPHTLKTRDIATEGRIPIEDVVDPNTRLLRADIDNAPLARDKEGAHGVFPRYDETNPLVQYAEDLLNGPDEYSRIIRDNSFSGKSGILFGIDSLSTDSIILKLLLAMKQGRKLDFVPRVDPRTAPMKALNRWGRKIHMPDEHLLPAQYLEELKELKRQIARGKIDKRKGLERLNRRWTSKVEDNTLYITGPDGVQSSAPMKTQTEVLSKINKVLHRFNQQFGTNYPDFIINPNTNWFEGPKIEGLFRSEGGFITKKPYNFFSNLTF